MTDVDGNKIGLLRIIVESGLVPWIFAAAVTVAIWAIGNAERADQTAQNLADLKVNVGSELAALRSQMDTGFTAVQNQIANLPDYAAQLHQLQIHATTVDNHLSALDGRADALERQQYQTTVRLGDIMRASQAPLPRSTK